MKTFIKWCVCVAVVAWGGLNAAGQMYVWLPKDRIMLFNDYPRTPILEPAGLDPQQSYYRIGAEGWWHDPSPAPGSLLISAPLALLGGTNHTFTSTTDDGRTAVWTFTDCRLGSPYLISGARVIPPANGYNATIMTNWMASFRNTDGAKIETPFYPDGVGTLYFDAINVFVGSTNQVVVEVATNMTDYFNASYEYVTNATQVTTNTQYAVVPFLYEHETEQYSNRWETVSVIDLNQVGGTPVQYMHTFNYRHAVRIRLRKTIVHTPLTPIDSDYFAAVDNIRVSRPPSDVVLSRPEVICNPGHPSVGSNFIVRCMASNAGTNEYERTWAGGGSNNDRTLQLWYRWRYLDQASNSWDSVNMTHVPGTGDGFGNGEIWQGSVPAQPRVGDLEYYFVTEFKGYRYQPRDYTLLTPGTPSPQNKYWPAPEYSELVSPRTFRGSTSQPGGREFSVRVRPAPSDYGTVSMVTGPPWNELNPIPMTLVSNDVWRGMIPVNNGGTTNVQFYFKGERKYEAGSEALSATPVYWARTGFETAVGEVPFGGECDELADRPVAPNEGYPIHVTTAGGGYIQVMFDLNTGKYAATRAEYQNFNEWTAPADVFTDSSGQATKQRYPNSFNAWPVNGLSKDKDYFQEMFVGYPAQTNMFINDPFSTLNGWQAGSAAYVSERLSADAYNRPPGETLSYRNVALRLKGGMASLPGGYVHNTKDTLPDGLARISFKARLGQVVNPYEATYYKQGFTLTNYMIRAYVKASGEMSSENPSISVLGYFLDPDNYYEMRMTQIVDSDPVRDKRIQIALYKRRNGVETLLQEENPNTDMVLGTQYTVELRMYSTSQGATRIRGRVGSTEVLNFTDSSDPLRAGTCAFMSGECQAGFTVDGSGATSIPIRLFQTDSDATLMSGGWSLDILTETDVENLANPSISKWSLAPVGRWMAVTGNTPKGIYAVIPTQQMGIYLQPTRYGTTLSSEPQAPGTTAWTLFKEVTLSGFGYATYDIPIYNWRSHFAMLRVMGRTTDIQQIDVAVDELEVSAWHGQSSSDLSAGDTEQVNTIRNGEWAATEAWVSSEYVPGLNEGRVPGSFNLTQISPMTSVQLSTRYANVGEGWITNSTYVYNGEIFLDGPGGTNVFAANFNGRIQVKIGDTVILDPDSSSVTSLTNLFVRNRAWHPIEVRIGIGPDGVGGPLAGGAYGGYGVSYSRTLGASWVPLSDTGWGSFLRTENKYIVLDHTQEGRQVNGSAPPYTMGDWLGQTVRSPLLTSGVGLLEFDYQVLQAPAKLTVQFAPEWASSSWIDIRSWVVSNAMFSFKHELAYLGTNESGYLRVLNDRAGEAYTNAVVVIDNATVWDEPDVDNTSWRAYNVKVSDTDAQRVMLHGMDPLLDGSKACFLNNSQTAETLPDQILYEEAFVKSPLLPTGLGTLSFMARVYTINQPAHLTLYVTESEQGPLTPDIGSEWKAEVNFSITNDFYETYTFTPVDGRTYRAFKLVTSTSGGEQRVCVEELAVSEPVLPGFEISNVLPMCVDGNEYNPGRRQPLHNDLVGIQAQISNLREGPQDIRMFVSYYVGTNQWGIGNWPAGETETLPMTLVSASTGTYRTDPPLLGSIPVQEKNAVVQYAVWATYKDDRGTVFTNWQKRATFENPAWYYPTDLNATLGNASEWSPYYIVYDIPVGAIWINEINAKDGVTDGNHHAGENKFIEIAVPAEFDLAEWSLDIVNTSRGVSRILLPSGMPPQAAVTNGYAFFVIGESDDTRDPSVPPLPKQDYPGGVLGLSSKLPSDLPGGIRLRRPLGMYEHVVAYDWQPTWGGGWSGEIWAADDPEGKFEYVGSEMDGGSLSVVTNSIPYALPTAADWVSPWEWTPGQPNVDQVVPDANLMAPGVSNVVVVSHMSSLKGTQNSQRISPLSFRIKMDTSTNIYYVADAWYRFTSITVNGVEQLPTNAWGTVIEQADCSIELLNVQSNLNVQAVIALRNDVGGLDADGDILKWLLSFGDAPFAPTWYGINPYDPMSDRRELSIVERYWIDANPTVTNYLRGGVVGVFKEIATTNYFVTVTLDINNNNLTNLLGNNLVNDAVFKVEAKQPPFVPEWQTLRQFKFNAYSFDINHQSTLFVTNPFLNLLPEGDPEKPLAFRWVIEYVYPQLSTSILVPTNAPAIP